MKQRFTITTAIIVAMLASGCATILNEDSQKINVTTSDGKSVSGSIDGVPFTAPGTVSVKRAKADKIIMSDSPDCSKETALKSSVDTKFFINILSGGAFGSTTDYVSEKMWQYEDAVISCHR